MKKIRLDGTRAAKEQAWALLAQHEGIDFSPKQAAEASASLRAFLLGEDIDQWQEPVKIIVIREDEVLQAIELTRGPDGLMSLVRIVYHNGEAEHAPPMHFVIWDAGNRALNLLGEPVISN